MVEEEPWLRYTIALIRVGAEGFHSLVPERSRVEICHRGIGEHMIRQSAAELPEMSLVVPHASLHERPVTFEYSASTRHLAFGHERHGIRGGRWRWLWGPLTRRPRDLLCK
jgi:hypothetical protein